MDFGLQLVVKSCQCESPQFTGADWLPKFWWDFFSRGPQKNCCKNEIADLKKKIISKKKKKGHDAERPPIALGTPNLEGPRGILPTSLYGQSAPVNL
jgi:hypothetical protein